MRVRLNRDIHDGKRGDVFETEDSHPNITLKVGENITHNIPLSYVDIVDERQEDPRKPQDTYTHPIIENIRSPKRGLAALVGCDIAEINIKLK